VDWIQLISSQSGRVTPSSGNRSPMRRSRPLQWPRNKAANCDCWFCRVTRRMRSRGSAGEISCHLVMRSEADWFLDWRTVNTRTAQCRSSHHLCLCPEEVVGLTPTGVQRLETRSLAARLISRPDRGRQPTHGCEPPSRCAY
jgi:hypothetical protein